VCELDDHGNVTGIFGVFADVTELESARRAAEAATATKASFLANMSHEIRTPMNGVLGFTELLLAGDLSEEQRQRAEIIADSGRAMMRLLNDILDLSKVEAGQMKVAVEPFDLRHALKACMKLVTPALMRKGLQARCEIAPDVPKMVNGDGLRLRQIVLNLMGNAAKFTNQGSVTLRASVGANAGTIIEIVDTGIGIAPERQAAVFEQFVQANTGIAPRFGGSGLGLTISVQLAELMGGTLRLTSEPGVGTTFILTVPLPAIASTAALAPPGPLQHSRDDSEACAAARVLVAEDHDVNRLLMSDMLGRLGYRVDLAEDGVDAVSKVQSARSGGDPYSIVLMDMHMPRMDGLEATQVMRANGFDPASLPIVALTANAYADDIAACLASGMQAHLSKPITLADLDAAVRSWAVKPVVLPAIDDVPLLGPAIRERYRIRRTEALSALDEMVRSGRFEEAELADVADMMHKLAGTAGMFGEVALGEAAHALEEGLSNWPAEGRSERIRLAIEDIARAA
jgi:CheY-like chemotaxis protein